jgi:hypothetical protein
LKPFAFDDWDTYARYVIKKNMKTHERWLVSYADFTFGVFAVDVPISINAKARHKILRQPDYGSINPIKNKLTPAGDMFSAYHRTRSPLWM